ncbi:MAG: FkbM family methyltransferase [Rhodospirillales bacterium]|nr:FkbM family methyltransferase [Rhodospirillales bacterium]
MSIPDIYKQIDARYGRMLYNPNDRYIGRSLDLYGEFSEGEVELFRQVIKPNSIVLDIGANIGCHTVFLAQAMENTGRVIAFEPQRLLFQILCANLALNSLFNVQCLNEAIGDTEGTVLVPFLNPADKLSFGSLELGRHSEGETVKKITIDSLELPQCQFIKLDVEGMELMALAGARETISRCRPILYVENDREESSDDLIRLIASFGYRMYWHLTPLYNPDNHKKNQENVFENIISINMFCVHEDSQINVTHMEEVDVPAEA